jgi:GNAT superfamily N-acetyltransferase
MVIQVTNPDITTHLKNYDLEYLSQLRLQGAIALAQNTFRHDNKEKISFTLEASLNPEKYKERINGYGGNMDLQFWVSLINNQVVGLAGYYTLLEDCHEAAWLSWFCVEAKLQGQKMGLTLLETVILRLKEKGKSFLRLYTSDIGAERRAHKVYKQRGFQEFRSSHYDPETKTNLLYFQLPL